MDEGRLLHMFGQTCEAIFLLRCNVNSLFQCCHSVSKVSGNELSVQKLQSVEPPSVHALSSAVIFVHV